MYTASQQLEFCKVCKKRTFDRNTGIVCSLTMKKPDFDDYCPDYETDSKRVEKDVAMKEGNQLDYNVDFQETEIEEDTEMSVGKVILLILKIIVFIASLIATFAS